MLISDGNTDAVMDEEPDST